MKKNLLLCMLVIASTQLYSAAPAPLTKKEVTALIKKTQSNIKAVESMKKTFANDPDTLEGLEDQIEGQREKLADLQKLLLTAK